MNKFWSNDHSVTITPSIVVFATFFLLGLYFLFLVKTVLIMLFVAVIMMSALNPAVSRLEKKYKVPRIGGILIMYGLVFLVLSILVGLVVPPLVTQVQSLLKSYDFNLTPIQEQIREFKFSIEEVRNLIDSVGGSVMSLVGIISSTFSGIFTFFTISVMSVYLLIDRDYLHKKVNWFTHDKRHVKLAQEYIDSLEEQLGGWVRGQLILMFTIGLVTFIGLSLLGVPYALPLAIVAGFLEILPNLGPTLAAVPATLLALASGGWVLWAITVVFYIVVQQIENNVLVPKIMKENADVNPLITIVTILVGLELGGVIGALIAVPLYITFRSIYSLIRREMHAR